MSLAVYTDPEVKTIKISPVICACLDNDLHLASLNALEDQLLLTSWQALQKQPTQSQ